MIPETLNLEIYQGDTWRKSMQLTYPDGTPLDLSGWSFASQIRNRASRALEADIEIEVTDAENGALSLHLGPVATAELPLEPWGRSRPQTMLVWDLQATLPGEVIKTPLRGDVTVVRDVTRVEA